MRYALYRIHASRRAPRLRDAPEASRTPDLSREPKSSKAAEPRPAVREISLGSNDGIRTVKLRQPSIVWRVRRTLATPANH